MRKAVVSWVLCGMVVAGPGALAQGPGASPPAGPGAPGFDAGGPPAHGLQPPPPPDPVLGPARFALMGLDLAPEQRTKIHAILDAALQGGLGDVVRSFEDARRAVEIGVWDPASSTEPADAALRQLEAAGRRLLDARRTLARDLLSVLDEGQRRELLEIIHQPPPRRPA